MEKSKVLDYYDVLQVSRRAHPVVIAKTYRLLAALYHPDNRETGDAEAFKQLVEAYHVLSDPVRRAAHDREKFGTSAPRTGPAVSPDLNIPTPPERRQGDEQELREVILRVLYDVRRSRPYKPALSLMVISELLGCSIQDMEFTLWYLKAKKLVDVTDDADLAITVVGVDHLEANGAAARNAGRDVTSLPLPRPMPDGRLPDR